MDGVSNYSVGVWGNDMITAESLLKRSNEHLEMIYDELYGEGISEKEKPQIGSRQTLAVIRAVAEILEKMRTHGHG